MVWSTAVGEFVREEEDENATIISVGLLVDRRVSNVPVLDVVVDDTTRL